MGKTTKEMFPYTYMYDMDFPMAYTNGMRTPIYEIKGELYYVYKGIWYTAHEYFDILKLD